MHIARLNNAPELFYSLQGEGVSCGSPAVFLRLAGCNLACRWCDTKYSWGAGLYLTPAELAPRIAALCPPRLIITGGEPLLQQDELGELLALLPAELPIEVETNGTLFPPAELRERVTQWNVSPKLPHAGNAAKQALRPEVLAAFAELPNAWFKLVVRGEEDWPAIAALGLPRERLLLMPCAETRAVLEQRRPAIAQMCLRHGVRLGERLHLVLWDTCKGV